METLNTLFTTEGLRNILRFLHTFAGLIWIGHLYYLNFVQGGFMNEVDAPVKSVAQQKLFPKVFWWFRYGALWTWVIGFVLLLLQGSQEGAGFMWNSYWVNILTGAMLGTLMAINVWFVIWPTQKLVIANAINVAAGKPADASFASRVPRAGLASRTNVLFSIPMLFFMLSARHWTYGVEGVGVYFAVAILLMLVLEANVFKGKMGPLTTVKGVLTCGFVLLLVFILLISFLVPSAAAA